MSVDKILEASMKGNATEFTRLVQEDLNARTIKALSEKAKEKKENDEEE